METKIHLKHAKLYSHPPSSYQEQMASSEKKNRGYQLRCCVDPGQHASEPKKEANRLFRRGDQFGACSPSDFSLFRFLDFPFEAEAYALQNTALLAPEFKSAESCVCRGIKLATSSGSWSGRSHPNSRTLRRFHSPIPLPSTQHRASPPRSQRHPPNSPSAHNGLDTEPSCQA